MKASEMKNEELAKALMSRVPLDSNSHDDLREAAARLRKVTVRTDNSAVISELQRRLKVAEDALKDALEHVEIRKNNEYDDSEVVAACDSTIAKCNDALAAIREQGGGKPIRNCDRFETAEDAYNACPQFCDIDVKTMTDRELKIVEATTKCLEWLFAPIAEGGAK